MFVNRDRNSVIVCRSRLIWPCPDGPPYISLLCTGDVKSSKHRGCRQPLSDSTVFNAIGNRVIIIIMMMILMGNPCTDRVWPRQQRFLALSTTLSGRLEARILAAILNLLFCWWVECNSSSNNYPNASPFVLIDIACTGTQFPITLAYNYAITVHKTPAAGSRWKGLFLQSRWGFCHLFMLFCSPYYSNT